MHKKRGSAVLIAILLTTAIGTIVLGFGRVLYSEIINTTLYTSGVFAYYSAESGIEEGFLNYRFNRDQEIPSIDWTLGEKKSARSDITAKKVLASSVDRGTGTTVGPYKLSNIDQTYDLRMGFIGFQNEYPYYGKANDKRIALNYGDLSNAPGVFTVAKDNSLNIHFSTGYGFHANGLKIFARFDNKYENPLQENSILEMRVVVNQGGMTNEYKRILSANPDGTKNLLGAPDTSAIIPAIPYDCISLGTTCGFGIDNLMDTANIPQIASLSDVTLYLKPLFNDAQIMVDSSQCTSRSDACTLEKDTVVPGPYTTITSTGYYGGVVRTMEANIDRQSGSLYDLFDYVIYKAK